MIHNRYRSGLSLNNGIDNKAEVQEQDKRRLKNDRVASTRWKRWSLGGDGGDEIGMGKLHNKNNNNTNNIENINNNIIDNSSLKSQQLWNE